MATSSTLLAPRNTPGRRIASFAQSLSWRATGMLALLLALLFTGTSWLLSTQLAYPEILTDQPSFGTALVAPAPWIGLAGFFGLLLCGLLLVVISLSLVPHLEEKSRRCVTATGGVSGLSWIVSALLGLALLSLWRNVLAREIDAAAIVSLVLTRLIVPVLLALWTVVLARQFRAHRVLGWMGAIGLLLACVCSLIWVINGFLPIETGAYGIAGTLNIFSLLGESLWLFWLLLLGFRLMSRGRTSVGMVEVQHSKSVVSRRRLLLAAVRGTMGVAAGLTGVAFVGARTTLSILDQPDLEGDAVPSEPSFIGTLSYLAAWIYLRIVNPVHTIADQKRVLKSSTMPLPSGTLLEKVNVGGVLAERIGAKGAGSHRWILYTHGGGWAQGITDSHRSFVAQLSQTTGACGLIPEYRLTPEHPFPAGLNDCVAAYRWLLNQGVAASQIVIAGESAGGNLALATALALRESGDALPAAVIALSPATDMAMTGETFRSKAFVDPILGLGLAQDAFALYTNHGATDPRNPLVSPLYADMHGLPPTLLQVGTQEVLLSDSTRMAERLRAAGVETKLEVWPGMFHAFSAGSTYLPEGRLAAKHIVKFMLRHLEA